MVNVCDIQVMKPLLAEHGFHFSKAKGQNFLIAPWVPQYVLPVHLCRFAVRVP